MNDVVYLQTTNLQKLAEYERILGRHRIVVLQASHEDKPSELFTRDAKVRVLAVMREESNLFHPQDRSTPVDENNLRDLAVVDNITRLTCYVYNGSELTELKYESQIEGYIKPLEPTEDDPRFPVFGWDKRFVSKGLGLSYHDLRVMGAKVSARDQVLGQFTQHRLAFRHRRDLKSFPLGLQRTVDFSKSPIDFVDGNRYLNNEHIEMYGVGNGIRTALNSGVFWRAADNRRSGNYWNPGLNAGLPCTPKINKLTGQPDDIHETTFLKHDLDHHVFLPDLVYEGETDPLSLRVKIISRMMSEALTLVNADMLFVDTLKRSGYQYDYAKRRIYPLFASLDGDFAADPQALKKLFYANVRYALRGDESIYQEMGADPAALGAYKGKYMAYFAEDFRWTERNTQNMTENSANFQRWKQSVAPLKALKDYTKGCVTIAECIEALRNANPGKDLNTSSHDELIDMIFEWAWQSIIAPNLSAEKVEVDPEHALRSAFLKYMIGQMYIFDVFHFVPESTQYRENIRNYLLKKIDTLTLEDIENIRNFYAQFVDILFERKAITQEDQALYKEFFPLFPPFFINYDGPAENYLDLKSLSDQILTIS